MTVREAAERSCAVEVAPRLAGRSSDSQALRSSGSGRIPADADVRQPCKSCAWSDHGPPNARPRSREGRAQGSEYDNTRSSVLRSRYGKSRGGRRDPWMNQPEASVPRSPPKCSLKVQVGGAGAEGKNCHSPTGDAGQGANRVRVKAQMARRPAAAPQRCSFADRGDPGADQAAPGRTRYDHGCRTNWPARRQPMRWTPPRAAGIMPRATAWMASYQPSMRV